MPGFFVEALGATALVMVVLAGLGSLEYRLLRIQRKRECTMRTKPGVALEWLSSALFSDGLRVTKVEVFDHDNDRVFELVLEGTGAAVRDRTGRPAGRDPKCSM